ncbi:MAG TPA: DUF2157 domain-containing protein [Holophaga sp.]|nr:DUF2157 domain-containing protein [Holophaga sp.]
MHPHLDDALNRWQEAGLLDGAQVAALRSFEADRNAEGASRLRWPAILAASMGALLVGAGVLLFVAAHWDEMAPGPRFATVLVLVASFHLLGAVGAERVPRLAPALHGVGTLALGAGIFLAGQIFNLQEHWPGGVLLWALGALAGWLLLRDWVQATLLALLAPFWLAGEWVEAADRAWRFSELVMRVLAAGLLGLAVTYLSARREPGDGLARKALAWVGGLALLPLAIFAAAAGTASHHGLRPVPDAGPLAPLGWVLALGLPLAAAWGLRRAGVWMNGVAALWILVLALGRLPGLAVYAWCALGAAGLVAWGLHEFRRERVNLGVAGFALTVLLFYFSDVMDKLDRSLGLMGLGVLFLAGGWALERLRRRLNARILGGAA